MMRRILVDTGPLVAILSASDQHHGRCVEQLKTIAPPLLTCWPVLTEAAWLLRSRPQAVHKLLGGFGNGLLQLLPLEERDLVAIDDYLRQYADAGLQLADAALAALAEREGIATIFTLDRRDFHLLRLKDGRSLTLLPE